MARWYPLEPVDAEFLGSAPHIFHYQKPFDATPEHVWKSLVSDASAAAWGRLINEVSWTSAPPFGLGATRESAAFGTRSRSRYFRWDEGHGYSMYVHESTAPVFKRYAEDFILEPNDGGTLFKFYGGGRTKGGICVTVQGVCPCVEGISWAHRQRRPTLFRQTSLTYGPKAKEPEGVHES
jgi:hypothetical protein